MAPPEFDSLAAQRRRSSRLHAGPKRAQFSRESRSNEAAGQPATAPGTRWPCI